MAHAWRTFTAGVHATAGAFAVLAAAGVLVLVFLTVADVGSREVSNKPITGVPELSALVLASIALLGFAHAEVVNLHVRTGILADRLPPRVKAAAQAVGGLVLCGLLVWIVVATADRAVQSVSTGEQALGLVSIPVWPVRVLIPIGVGLLAIELLIRVVGAAGSFRHGGTTGEEIPSEPEYLA